MGTVEGAGLPLYGHGLNSEDVRRKLMFSFGLRKIKRVVWMRETPRL
jgi:hypothetical protein